MLKLYDYFRSSASFRVRIALNLKSLDYDLIPVHLVNDGGEHHKANYVAINPQRLVPTLQIENKFLSQSLAIIEYLEDCYPEPSLLPKDPYKKALARSLAMMIACDTHPLNNLRVLNYLKDDLHVNDKQKNAWYQHWLAISFTAFEQQLERQQLCSLFCMGDTPGIADICLIPQVYNARRFNCDLSAYPKIVAIEKHCKELDAFKKAWPEEMVA